MSGTDRFEKYRKMLNVIRVPPPAVAGAMRKDGGFTEEEINNFLENPSGPQVAVQMTPIAPPPRGPPPQAPPPRGPSSQAPPPPAAPSNSAAPRPPPPNPPPPPSSSSSSNSEFGQLPPKPSLPPPKPKSMIVTDNPLSASDNDSSHTSDHSADNTDDGNDAEAEDSSYTTKYGPFAPGNAENPKWLTPIIRARTEVPKQQLSRLLLKGEEVTGQFDVMYETKPPSFLGDLMFYVFTFMTVGVYAAIMAWCPDILPSCICGRYMRRAKMVVTSKGRVICWDLVISRSLQGFSLDNRIHYSYSNSTTIYMIKDLKQMTLKYTKASCWGQFQDHIELAFHSFNHARNASGMFLRTKPNRTFLGTIASFLSGSVDAGTAVADRSPSIVRVLSDRLDLIYPDPSVHRGREGIEDMAALAEKLNKAFGRAGSCNVPNNWCPDVFVPVLHDSSMPLSSSGVREMTHDLENITLLDTGAGGDEMVNAPIKWMPLGDGEMIIAAVGHREPFGIIECLLDMVTFGVWCCLGPRRHSAVILTNRRIVEVSINQHKGKVPAGLFEKPSLTFFDISISSLYPGEITAGYLNSDSRGVTSGLQTSGGHLVVSHLPQRNVSFAQKMQMCHSRQKSLATELPQCLPPVVGTTHVNFDGKRGATTKYLPMLAGEIPLHHYEGGKRWVPCCLLPSTLADHFVNRVYLCTFPPSCWGGFLSTLSCIFSLGIRPYNSSSEVIITTNTAFYLSVHAHAQTCETFCCSPTETPFFMSWVPIRSVQQLTTTIHANGVHQDGVCCHCCLKMQTAKRSSTHTINLHTHSGFSFPITDTVPNKNWTKSTTYTRTVAIYGAVQAAIMEENV